MVDDLGPRGATVPPRERYVGDPRWAPRLVVRDPFTHPLAFLGLVPVVVFLFIAAQVAAPALREGAWPGLGVALVPGAIALWSLARLLRRRRRAQRTPVTLEIGPEGIVAPGLGRVPWEDVRRIGVEVVWSTDDEGVSRRWTVLVSTEQGQHAQQPFRLTSEVASTSLERVVSTIEAYHDVERGRRTAR